MTRRLIKVVDEALAKYAGSYAPSMTSSGQQDLNPHQKKALEYATNAEYWLKNKAASDPALASAVLAVYYQLRLVTENPDMAEAMRELAFTRRIGG